MGKAEWGVDPEFFGPRHAHREDRIVRKIVATTEPGLHLECAAGVGSLSATLARIGHTVVAADSSLRSLAVRCDDPAKTNRVLQVVADMTRLPFADHVFTSATSAETLEHIDADQQAVQEMARILVSGGQFVGTVPAGSSQWSDWDEWAGHLRRYSKSEVEALLDEAGFEHEVTMWGWPMVRLYDGIFLKWVNRRRRRQPGVIADDPLLKGISSLRNRTWLVTVVRSIFAVDRAFDGSPWGVGILFAARKTG